MNKRISKSILIIGIIIIVGLLLTTVSNATLTITTSKSTVSPGESFNVTVSVGSNEAGAINLSASNGTLSQTYVDLMSQSSLTISCVAGSSGTITINASGLVANYASETEGTQSASKSVIIKQPTPTTPTTPNTPSTPTTKPSTNTPTKPSTKPSNPSTPTTSTKSNNSKLASLQIAEGVITPEFNSNVREYAVMVPNEITKLSIAASQEHSRATVRIVGNEELQVGDNTVEIIVTAEDGSTSTYKIYATRALPELNLQTLSICYIDENNQKVELKLEPQFVFNTYEYKSLEKLSYTVKELQVDAIANRENAKVEIIGNKEIKAGKNEITIKVTLPNEEGLEEQKTYKITIEREDEPVIVPLTTMQKIKNWFSGVGASVGGWITANFDRIISGMLLIVAASFVGLTIYFAYDYKNYQRILAKLAEYNKENLNQRASVALNPEMANINENVEPIDIAKDETEIQETNEKPDEEPKAIKGRRFK